MDASQRPQLASRPNATRIICPPLYPRNQTLWELLCAGENVQRPRFSHATLLQALAAAIFTKSAGTRGWHAAAGQAFGAELRPVPRSARPCSRRAPYRLSRARGEFSNLIHGATETGDCHSMWGHAFLPPQIRPGQASLKKCNVGLLPDRRTVRPPKSPGSCMGILRPKPGGPGPSTRFSSEAA